MSNYAPVNEESSDRIRVRVTEDIDTFEGVDRRDYDLGENDVVTRPWADASRLLNSEKAEVI